MSHPDTIQRTLVHVRRQPFGKNYIYAGMWWLTLFPGATLILLVVAINLFSDWLRDELNPKLARQT